MKMLRAVVTTLLTITLGVAIAEATEVSGSLSPFDPPFLPVLVKADSSGKISTVSPAFSLPPDLSRQMNSDLERIVAEPEVAEYAHSYGQFVVNLALKVTPRTDGRFDANFRMISIDPVPSGEWYWVKVNGRWYSLANATAGSLRSRP